MIESMGDDSWVGKSGVASTSSDLCVVQRVIFFKSFLDAYSLNA